MPDHRICPQKKLFYIAGSPSRVLKVRFPKIRRMKQAVIIRINWIFHRYPIVNQVHADGNHPRHQTPQKQLRCQILPDFPQIQKHQRHQIHDIRHLEAEQDSTKQAE